MGDVLAGLDEIDWAGLEDAYGPSVDTPAQLRAIRAGGEGAAGALGELEAAVYHQGSYYPAAAPAVRFLIALATSPGVPDRAPILSLLAEMSGGHARDAVVGWNPHAFRSTPGPPDYPEARAAIEAIVAAALRYLPLLGDPDERVRAHAAYLIGGVPFHDDRGAARTALAAAVAGETSPAAAASMLLAFARHAPDGPLPEASLMDPMVAGARAVADAWVGRADVAALESAAVLEADQHGVFPWAGGSLAALAVRALGEVPGAAGALRRILDAWLARGGPAFPFSDDWSDAPMWPSPNDQCRDELLRAVVLLLARQLFAGVGPERASDPFLAEELTDAQRDLLGVTAEHGLAVPVPGIPWIDRESMGRFLRGGEPLDRKLGGVPVWKALHRAADAATPDEEPATLLAALAELSAEDLFALCVDIAGGAYPRPNGGGMCVPRDLWSRIEGLLAPHWDALAEQLSAYRGELLVGDDVAHEPARLALAPWFAAGQAPPEELDPLLVVGLPIEAEAARAIIEALPRARRSVLVGRMKAPRRVQYYELCDREVVARETVAAFLDPAWAAPRFMTEEMLTKLGDAVLSPLREALDGDDELAPKKRSLIERIVAQLGGEVIELVLDVWPEGDQLCAALLGEDDEVLLELTWPAVPEAEHVARLAEAIAEPKLTTIDILDEAIDHGLAYRLQRLIAELGVRMVSTGGSSMTTS